MKTGFRFRIMPNKFGLTVWFSPSIDYDQYRAVTLHLLFWEFAYIWAYNVRYGGIT